MGFVEYLRARKALTIFAIVLLAIMAFSTLSSWVAIHHVHRTYSAHESGYSFSVGDRDGSGAAIDPGPHALSDLDFKVPLGIFFGVASFLSIILATILGTSLNKENGRGGFAFTKPISRERLALTFMAIDVAAILVSFAYGVALLYLAFSVFGIAGKVFAEPGAASIALAGLGSAFMWYGLLQAVTSARSSSGGLFVGLSWPFFMVALGLYSVDTFGAIFHDAIVAVDFFNPLAYFGFSTHNLDVSVTSVLGFAPGLSIALTWGIAIAACAIAIFRWKRMEA